MNLLIATHIGNEGMDFKQCQMVTAFEPPPTITNYIQARGRARKAGSRYCWLVPESQPERSKVENKKEQLVMSVGPGGCLEGGRLGWGGVEGLLGGGERGRGLWEGGGSA